MTPTAAPTSLYFQRSTTTRGTFLLFLWVIYIVMSPLYVLPSGLPQPADAVLVLLIALLLTGFFVSIAVPRDLYLLAGSFLAVVFVVNGGWWLHDGDLKFLLSSAYFLYNLLVMVAVISLIRAAGNQFVTVTRAALLASLVLELAVAVLTTGDHPLRETGTFNNPNQLGYWSLLVGGCLMLLKGRERLRLADLLAFATIGILCAMSLSKGAMVGFAVLLSSAVWFQGTNYRAAVLSLLVALLAMLLAALVRPEALARFLTEGLPARVVERLDSIGKPAHDSLEGRGYDRIWHHPEYLVIGSGEGAYYRFDSIPYELHSTFAQLVFAYGLLGAATFAGLLWLVFRRAPLAHLAYFMPAVLYGLTHNGIRNTLLWVFFGLVFALSRYARPETR